MPKELLLALLEEKSGFRKKYRKNSNIVIIFYVKISNLIKTLCYHKKSKHGKNTVFSQCFVVNFFFLKSRVGPFSRVCLVTVNKHFFKA